MSHRRLFCTVPLTHLRRLALTPPLRRLTLTPTLRQFCAHHGSCMLSHSSLSLSPSAVRVSFQSARSSSVHQEAKVSTASEPSSVLYDRCRVVTSPCSQSLPSPPPLRHSLLSRSQHTPATARVVSGLAPNDSNVTPTQTPPPSQYVISRDEGQQVAPPGTGRAPLGAIQPDHLAAVEQKLINSIEKLFLSKHNYALYTKDIIFENRIRRKTTHGIFAYMRQIMLLRFVAGFRFCYVTANVLQSSCHVEDSTVRIRWQMMGVGMLKYLQQGKLMRSFTQDEMRRHSIPWLDGYSVFHINNVGTVHRHVVDKVMPDYDGCENNGDKSLAGRLASRVAAVHSTGVQK